MLHVLDMRNVYLSFLGLGKYNKEKNSYEYEPAYYELGNKRTLEKVNFVQVAELKLLGAKRFDSILIVATERSKSHHGLALGKEVETLGGSITWIEITEGFTPEIQWSWFEQIVDKIQEGDRLTVDITHGYRAIPIIFSTALSFLERAKRIKLDGVYYAAFESNPSCVPIIDLKEFFVVSDWAEAISRFSDQLDARKVAELAMMAEEYQIGPLKDQRLIENLETLGRRVRNVEVDWVADVVLAIRNIIKKESSNEKTVDKILLDLIKTKLSVFPEIDTVPERYSVSYYEFQLSIIELLITHGLFMQAVTAMREFIAAIGMVHLKKGNPNNKKNRTRRERHCEIFYHMLEFRPENWKFSGNKLKIVKELQPLYEKIKKYNLTEEVRSCLTELTTLRNGFDHAWAGKKEPAAEILKEACELFESLKEIFEKLKKANLFT